MSIILKPLIFVYPFFHVIIFDLENNDSCGIVFIIIDRINSYFQS
jgi:hypothetical protein